MPILASLTQEPKPVTQDESDRVLALVRKHASASSWTNLVRSLRAKPDPYPFTIRD